MKIAIQSLVLGTALCLGLCAGSALAQDAATAPQSMPEGGEHRGHGGMSPDKQLEHMTKALDLTADQQAQIKPLLEAHQQQAMQLRQDTSISQDDKHTKMQALNTDTHTKIEAVLTDTQKAKFEKMQQHHEGQWQHGGGQPQ
jgi:Spy/CpxP family protein refolding chaperone